LSGEETADSLAHLAQGFLQARFAFAKSFAQDIDLIAGEMAGFPKWWSGEIPKPLFNVIQQAQRAMLGLRLRPQRTGYEAECDSCEDGRKERSARVTADAIFHFVISLFRRAMRLLGDVIWFDHNAV